MLKCKAPFHSRFSGFPIFRSKDALCPGAPAGLSRESSDGRFDVRGYTLIEISVVIVLIGVIFLMAIPRVQDTLTHDRMRSAVRNLSGTARELKASAVREQVDHYLHLDLDQRRAWSTRDDMTAENRTLRRNQARSLPSGVRIADVALADEGKKNQGEVIIRFFSQGYVQPAAIHLTDEERTMTLIFQPFLSTFEVQDKYVDVWQKSK